MKEKLKKIGALIGFVLALFTFIFYIWFSYIVMCAIPGNRMF